MGAQILGRQNDTLAPLIVRGGSLQGIEYDLPMASAQVKSAIMLAALSADGDTVIHQPALSRDHTERMVTAMGGSIEENGLDLVIHPSKLKAVDITVPGRHQFSSVLDCGWPVPSKRSHPGPWCWSQPQQDRNHSRAAGDGRWRRTETG